MKKILGIVVLFLFIPLLCVFSDTYNATYHYYYNRGVWFSISFFQADSANLAFDSSSRIQASTPVPYGTYDKSENYSHVADIVSFSNIDYTCNIKLRYSAFDNGRNLINMKLKCIYYDETHNENEVVGVYSTQKKNSGPSLLPFIEIEPFCPTWSATNMGSKVAMLYVLADPNGSGSGDFSAKIVMEITEP